MGITHPPMPVEGRFIGKNPKFYVFYYTKASEFCIFRAKIAPP